MNLKLKRLVRTSTSEQYALFDLDRLDGAAQPATIGKLDLHFTSEGMYGTLLLWDESIRILASAERRAFVRMLLSDLAQPMGVPNEYVVELFAPTLDQYEVIHNVGLDEDDADDGDTEDEEERVDLLDEETELSIDEELAGGDEDEYADLTGEVGAEADVSGTLPPSAPRVSSTQRR